MAKLRNMSKNTGSVPGNSKGGSNGSGTENPIQLREMKLSDMDGLMKLKNAEGWNQKEKDWELLINYQDSVNLVATVDDQVVGSVCGINYDHTLAWIGMMLVDRNHRGKGISRLLLTEAIARLEKCDSIKLDATPAGRPVYVKFGFKDEYTLYRMTNPSVPEISQAEAHAGTHAGTHEGNPEVTPAGEVFGIPAGKAAEAGIDAGLMVPVDLSEVIEYDRQIFGADRGDLIRHLYEGHPGLARIIREDGKIAGYCLGRNGVKYTQLGPVYAESERMAKSLICSAINSIPGEAAVVDIAADQTNLMQWLEDHGFTAQRPFERMYLNNNPHPGVIEKQYLIGGPELG